MYRFTPPTATFRAGADGTFWGRVANLTGLAVVLHTDGRVTTVATAPAASDDGIDTVWPGGRTYDISDEQAATLIDAGYSEHLEEVP